MLTIYQLRVFVTFSETLSVKETARRLHVTPPAISRQLDLLEKSSVPTLFKKTGRTKGLTAQGENFLHAAEAVLFALDKLEALIQRRDSRGDIGSLGIAASFGPSVSILPMAIRIFRRDHPLLRVNLRTESSPTVEQIVLKGEIEIGVMVDFFRHPNHDSLNYIPLRKEHLVSFASPEHPLAKKATVRLAELCDYPFVLLKSKHANVTRVEAMIKQITKQSHLDSATYVETGDSLKALVRSGVGVGIFYRDNLDLDFREGKLKILNVPTLRLSYPSFIIHRHDKPLSPYARAFIAILRRWSRENVQSRTRHRHKEKLKLQERSSK